MLKKLMDSFARFKEWDRVNTEKTVNKHMYVEKFSSFILILGFFGTTWAFAWYAHIIGPWVDQLLGLGPHDIDSIGKIRWRRMYSTAFCAPPIIYAIIRYSYTQCKKRRKPAFLLPK
jgi:hypothetical protein